MRFVYRPCAHYEEDAATVPGEGAAVVIANHTNHKDAVFLMSALGKNTVSLVARDWYEKPKFKWIMKGAGCIPCDRNGLDTEWLREAVDAVKSGKSVLIFPEGRTRKDGELNEFKSGFAMLAALTGAPVISIGLSGQYKLFCRTHYTVGRPQNFDRRCSMKADYLREKSAELRSYVAELKRKSIDISK